MRRDKAPGARFGRNKQQDVDFAVLSAARALSAFDPLLALRHVALRSDPAALSLRGVAMAQLGDYAAARKLLGRAVRSERSDPQMRARCLAALGEIALIQRDLGAAGRTLESAAIELDALGDRTNVLFTRLQLVRRLVIMGNVDEADVALAALEFRGAPTGLRAFSDLVRADIELRKLRPKKARAALARAQRAAVEANIDALSNEIDKARRDLDAPVARIVCEGVERSATIDDAALLLASNDLVIDACRREVRATNSVVTLVTRPVLLALAVGLGTASPGDVPRNALAEQAFGVRRANESVRARLRVEIGRLRSELRAVARVFSTDRGYALSPRDATRVSVLLPPTPGDASAIIALLRSGESWTTSALAAALGIGQRTVQRALLTLRDAGRVEGIGHGRSQRWVARAPQQFATNLLLVTPSSLR